MSNLVKIDLSQPEKFQMASVVIKNSRLGVTSNKRLLAIRKGYLYYYSNVPKQFKGTNNPNNNLGDAKILQTLHQLPKCSIQVVNIKQIKGYQNNSSYFSIEFQAKHMLERQDIRRTMTLQEYNFSPKNTKQNIVWQFTCDNQFIKQRWVSALEGLLAYYTKEKKDIEKFFSDNKSDVSSGGRNSSIPWRESQSMNKKNGYGGGSSNGSTGGGQVNYLQVNNGGVINMNKQPSQQIHLLSAFGPSDQQSRLRGVSAATEKNSNQDSPNNGKKFSNKMYSPSQKHSSMAQQQYEDVSTVTLVSKPKSPAGSITNHLSPSSASDSLPKLSHSKSGPVSGNVSEASQTSSSPKHQQPQSPINMMYKKSTEQEGQCVESSSSASSSALKNSSVNSKRGRFNSVIEQEDHQSLIQTPSQTPQKIISKESAQMSDIQDEGNQDQEEDDKVDQFQTMNAGQAKNKQKKKSTSPPYFRKLTSGFSSCEQSNYDNSSFQHNPAQIPQELILPQSQKTYYKIQNKFLCHSMGFQQKISIQKQFWDIVQSFRQNSANGFKEFVQYLSRQQQQQQSMSQQQNSKFIISERHNNGLNMKFGDIFYKVCFTTSQNLIINGKEKIFFDQQNIKNLKRQYKIYNDLFNHVIIHELKKQMSQSIKLRVPLCCYIQYKGIIALAFDKSQEQHPIPSVNQASKAFPHELSTLKTHQYPLSCFIYKQVISQNNENFLILYLNKSTINNCNRQQARRNYLKEIIGVKRSEKHSNIQFDPPFSSQIVEKAKRQNASTSIESLENYITALTSLTHFEGICPKQEIIEILEMIHFCKKLRTIYRAGQGEIHETHFLNLILKQDSNIMKMVEQSGCDNIPKIKGIFFNLIRYYMGIKCSINKSVFLDKNKNDKISTSASVSSSNQEKHPSSSDPILSTQVQPLIHTFDLSKLQLFESSEHIGRFIQEQKIQLAQRALQIKRLVYPATEAGCAGNSLSSSAPISSVAVTTTNSTAITEASRLDILYYTISLHFHQKDYLSCVRLCKEYQQQQLQSGLYSLPPAKLFMLYLLMMKTYAEISESQLTECFEKICDLIYFNYGDGRGQQNSNFITVYCVASYYYTKLSVKKKYAQQSNKLFNVATQLLESAGSLCLQLFGQSSKQYVDILMDLARIYQGKGNSVSNKKKSGQETAAEYFNKARSIAISMQKKNNHNNSQMIIDILLYEFNLQSKDKSKTQRCEKILDEIFQRLSNRNSPHHFCDQKKIINIYINQFDFGMLREKRFLCVQSVENLWKMDTSHSRNTAIQLAYKLAVHEKLISVDALGSILHAKEEQGINLALELPKCKLELQQEYRQNNYESFYQMIKDIFEGDQEKLMQSVCLLGEKQLLHSSTVQR